MSPKKKKNRLRMKVSSNPKYKRAAGTSIFISKINAALFCCNHFSKEYLNPQVRINKTINKYTVDITLDLQD